MATKLVVNWNEQPNSILYRSAGGTASYTVAAGKYARVVATVERSGYITLDGNTVLEGETLSYETLSNNYGSSTTIWTCPAGRVAEVEYHYRQTSDVSLYIVGNSTNSRALTVGERVIVPAGSYIRNAASLQQVALTVRYLDLELSGGKTTKEFRVPTGTAIVCNAGTGGDAYCHIELYNEIT